MRDTIDYREMGSRIRDLRLHLGLTQEQLAEAVDISPSFVGHIERGEKKSSLETIKRMAECLGTTMDYIVEGKSNRCNQQSCALYADLKRVIDSYGDHMTSNLRPTRQKR